MVHDEYQREVFKTKARTATAEDFSDIELPDYAHHNRVIIDVVTLDSASCAPCQYMVQAVQAAAERLGQQVDVREHKITTRSGLGHMSKLGVGQIPTICIDGQVKFPSMIPDIRTLIKAIEDTVNSKKTRP
jgi:uroporphyrinogen decarboxylase